MRIINKRVGKLLTEIALTGILVIISIPVWASIQIRSYAQTAKYYSNTSLIDIVPIVPMDSQIKSYNEYNGNNTIRGKYIVKNYSAQEKSYRLLFAISKKSTINIQGLTIEINEFKVNLTDLKNYDDNYFNYYILDKNVISDYEERCYYLRLWQDSNDGETLWYKLEVL